MQKVTQTNVRKVLSEQLRLIEPQFHLETDGRRIIGTIISPTFKGKRDHQRQDMIRAALDEAFGTDGSKRIGMLLAFTPDEWNLDADSLPAPRRRKVG